MVSARQLFGDFQYYRQHTTYFRAQRERRPYFSPLKATPARLKVLEEMAVWCVGRGIDPREWLYSLFAVRHWRFPPLLESSHLQSEKHLPRFQAIEDYDLYRRRLYETESPAARQRRFDPNRDLSHTAELAKTQYLRTGGPGQCMAVMAEETLGYHPESGVCRICSGARQCADLLVRTVGFDILALRRGEITVDQILDSR